jgi:CRP-like cAMP-binding protein
MSGKKDSMSSVTNRSPGPTNQLLSRLPRKECERLLTRAESVDLIFGAELYEPGEIITDVYFPTSGIISLIVTDGEDANLEVGIVGREGMVGLPVFMGVKTSRNRALVQGAGSALRMTATTFGKECNHDGALSKALRRYSHSLLTQISQSALCNRFHPIDARLARWLLATRDRMASDEFQLTQEFLSSMLGVRREGVSKAAGILQNDGIITYNRGSLKILKPAKLEAVACTCYAIIKEN